jgi:hypothetical protein
VLTGEGGGRDPSALRTDDASVALDPEEVDIDLHRFRQLAEEGLRLARTADREGALELLLAAEEAYGGDLLEDDRDVLWLVDRREELRTLYVSVARASAQLVGEADPDRAMRLLLRVLDRDATTSPPTSASAGRCCAAAGTARHDAGTASTPSAWPSSTSPRCRCTTSGARPKPGVARVV